MAAASQVLRRHLEGARLECAFAPWGERLLALRMQGRDRFGDAQDLFLCGEFFGTHPDLVLASQGEVLWAMHGRRRVQGDKFSIPAPKPPPGRTLRRGALAPSDLLHRIARGDFSPSVVERAGLPVEAWAFPFHAQGELRPAQGMLAALSAVARARLQSMALSDLRASIRERLRGQHERALRTLRKKEEEFSETRDVESLRHQGEALKLHLRQIPARATAISLPDPLSPGETVEVVLEEHLSPTENMERIFRRYRRLRSRAAHLGQEIEDLTGRVRQLSDSLADVENARGMEELRELRDRLLPEESQGDGRTQGRRSGPLRFYTTGGHEVRVGRSANENDALTRGARPGDLWFHTKDRQGAHCILRPLPGRPVGAPDRLDAALLAAFYSKQRGGSHVPVDYTFVRHVRRPRGAPPGFVLYDHHETLFVTPDPDAIEAIRRRPGSSRS